ncbi:hypothetical protein HMPREF0293_0467, partial [Corynebacterium glucuronolyticum ATCC 51866]
MGCHTGRPPSGGIPHEARRASRFYFGYAKWGPKALFELRFLTP